MTKVYLAECEDCTYGNYPFGACRCDSIYIKNGKCRMYIKREKSK